MTTGKNKPLWLLGARIWAEYRIGMKPELWEFLSVDGYGIFYFQNRKTKVVMGKTIYQLSGYPGFKPFLINLDYLDPNKLIVDANGEVVEHRRKDAVT